MGRKIKDYELCITMIRKHDKGIAFDDKLGGAKSTHGAMVPKESRSGEFERVGEFSQHWLAKVARVDSGVKKENPQKTCKAWGVDRVLLDDKRVSFNVSSLKAIKLVGNSKSKPPSLAIRVHWETIRKEEVTEQETRKVEGRMGRVQLRNPNSASWYARVKFKRVSQNAKRAARKGRGFGFLKPKGCPVKSRNGLASKSRGTKHARHEKMRSDGRFLPSELRTIPFKGGGNDTNMGMEVIQGKKVAGKGGEHDDGGKDESEKIVHQKWHNPKGWASGYWALGFVRPKRKRECSWAEMSLVMFGLGWKGVGIDLGLGWKDKIS